VSPKALKSVIVSVLEALEAAGNRWNGVLMRILPNLRSTGTGLRVEKGMMGMEIDFISHISPTMPKYGNVFSPLISTKRAGLGLSIKTKGCLL